MDDFPVDEADDLSQLLLSPSGSDFDALHCNTLNPPSPILTPSQLNFAWSSDDIPLFLYDDGYADAHSELSDTSTSRSKRDSSATLRSRQPTAAHAKSHNRESSASSISNVALANPALGILGSSESSTSVDSMGTFGPRSRRRTLRASQISRHSVTSLSTKDAEPSSDLDFEVSPAGDFDEADSLDSPSPPSRQSRRAPSGAFYHPVVYVDAKPGRKSDFQLHGSNLAAQASLGGALSGQMVPEGQPNDNDDNDEEDEYMTPTKATSKSRSRISSQMWGYGQYKDSISTHKHISCTSPPAQIVQLEDAAPDRSALLHLHLSTPSPPRRKAIELYDRGAVNANVENSSPSRVAHEAAQRHRRERSAKLVTQAHPQAQAHPPPERLIIPRLGLEDDWLQDIYVQFLIDQEGFRAANPLFAFTGIIRRRSSQHNVRAPGGVRTMAQFKPATRQAFHFHYAPFETPPILRRVTVNGDDTHDYVSKQALLTLKVNGVYVLHGHEFSVASANHPHNDAEPVKLHWQFEYLIDDRVADTSGRVMDGEKILTPLTFSCSPGLLLPQQARKNSIMHVFKKGVAPKLVAEKLQPPGFVQPSGAAAMNQNGNPKGMTGSGGMGSPTKAQPGSPPQVPGFFSSKSHGWGLHRRGQSHGARRPEMQKGVGFSPPRAPMPLPLGPGYDNTVLDISRPSGALDGRTAPPSVHLNRRLRRNSSAGEHAASPVRLHFGTGGSSGHRHNVHHAHHRREASHVVNGSGAQTQMQMQAQQKPTFSPSRHIVPPDRLSKLLDKENSAGGKENAAPLSAPQLFVFPVPDRNSSGFVPLAPRPRHSPMKSRDLGRVQI